MSEDPKGNTDFGKQIADRWRELQQTVTSIAAQAGRSGESVTILGVTKYVDAAMARLLAEAGCMDLAENRPQMLWEKAEALEDLPIRWHLIGHLQRNKVRRTLPLLAWIHSVDSIRLIDALGEESTQQGISLNLLIEVNATGEPAKTGATPEEIPSLLEAALRWNSLRVGGLMGMAPLEGGSTAASKTFAAIRMLRDAMSQRFGSDLPMPHLSMGMSGDFREAIQEGATMIRIGSALFP
ncbi:MAG: YggS family pyridoxal phosphate-dependent enzyme [Pirellulaceae bacterium]|jgi:pyridoxal phosphate enzyme (YggS family)